MAEETWKDPREGVELPKKKIVVLVSGGGTNLQALIDAQNRGELGGGEEKKDNERQKDGEEPKKDNERNSGEEQKRDGERQKDGEERKADAEPIPAGENNTQDKEADRKGAEQLLELLNDGEKRHREELNRHRRVRRPPVEKDW